MRLIWTDEALIDAEAIAAYLFERNPTAATAVVAAIFEATNKLAKFPLIGPSLGSSEFRVLTVPKYGYIIVYHVGPNVINIVNVHHGRTDWLSEFV